MDLNQFTKNFASQFDETDATVFSPETVYKSIDEWSSMIALSIIAMVDEEYNVKIKGDDIRNSKTVEDLFTIVSSRL
jgi:acyl carrier protein